MGQTLGDLYIFLPFAYRFIGMFYIVIFFPEVSWAQHYNFFFASLFSGSGDVVQLVVCLPRMCEAMGLVPNTPINCT